MVVVAVPGQNEANFRIAAGHYPCATYHGLQVVSRAKYSGKRDYSLLGSKPKSSSQICYVRRSLVRGPLALEWVPEWEYSVGFAQVTPGVDERPVEIRLGDCSKRARSRTYPSHPSKLATKY